MKLFDGALPTLERALDARQARQTALASDLANADTPGFMPVDVDFEAAMRSALDGGDVRRTDDRHLGDAGAAVGLLATESEALAGAATPDGNRVEVDRVLGELAANGMQYTAAARAAGKQLAMLRYVVTEGNG
ncbi:MAG: flagellar basal body rod protein FlgB [Deltaproteobacteria bacterium]|nr:flagellar basal body rod protein FlgB [Deltaproteobacteria bacterium]